MLHPDNNDMRGAISNEKGGTLTEHQGAYVLPGEGVPLLTAKHRILLAETASAGGRHQRRRLKQWTDDLVYVCRRCAAYARGEDTGQWVPAWKRRRLDPACTDEIRPELAVA